MVDSVLDQVTRYNIGNCRKFLGFIDDKYSKNKNSRDIKRYIIRALSSLELIEEFTIEDTFKIKSTSKIGKSLEEVISNGAEESNVNKSKLKKEVYLAFKKIKRYLRKY
ncbi:MAG TPA: hypothetical protein VJB94_01545 [Candidatus Nanoarchaeia archaeon]|nr:hypothetical protein [Candidatus Nanoarchaeia archaeon]